LDTCKGYMPGFPSSKTKENPTSTDSLYSTSYFTEETLSKYHTQG